MLEIWLNPDGSTRGKKVEKRYNRTEQTQHPPGGTAKDWGVTLCRCRGCSSCCYAAYSDKGYFYVC